LLGSETQEESLKLQKCYSRFLKAWTAYSKYLKTQVLEANQFVYCQYVGSFFKLNLVDHSADDQSVCFMPNREMLHDKGVEYSAKRPCNYEVVPVDSLLKSGVIRAVHRVNYKQIARACAVS
jgi:hypothetical protein